MNAAFVWPAGVFFGGGGKSFYDLMFYKCFYCDIRRKIEAKVEMTVSVNFISLV
jgi:hypothetical protein